MLCSLYVFGPVAVVAFVFPSGRSLGIVLLVFSKFWHGARNYEIVRNRVRFSRFSRFFSPKKLGKWTKNGPKQDFLNVLKNFVINFY